MRLTVIALCALLLAGCSGIQQANVNHAITTKLKVGMTTDEVIRLLGRPDRKEAYGDLELLIYNDGITWVPVGVMRGSVVAWGNRLYEPTYRAEVTVKHR